MCVCVCYWVLLIVFDVLCLCNKELRVKHDQTGCYLRPPFLGTRILPSRQMAPPQRSAGRAATVIIIIIVLIVIVIVIVE